MTTGDVDHSETEGIKGVGNIEHDEIEVFEYLLPADTLLGAPIPEAGGRRQSARELLP